MTKVKGNIFTFKGVTDVSDCTTAEEVMQKAGLDWTVAKCEAYAKMNGLPDFNGNGYKDAKQFFDGADSYKPINNIFATYRTDINKPLGVVKERYTPVQNIDAFKFFNDAIDKNDVQWFTAGCYGYGEKVFVSAKLGDNILVNGKDPIDTYLVFSTSHDGSSGVKIIITPIRLICFNVMNAAIRNASNYITMRHTQSVHNKISQAIEVLGIAKKKIDFFAQAMEKMTKIKLTDSDVNDIFAKVLLTSKELEDLANYGYTADNLVKRQWAAMEAANVSTQKVNDLCKIVEYYNIGAGQQEWLGTGYGAYNAINGYYSNLAKEEGIKRMDNLLYGTQSNKIKLASDLILN